ncbi:MAG: RDD family protein [Candidatus Hodarchaeales archaeon]|jgi:uncharacterized RDD family membrane protein YckC
MVKICTRCGAKNDFDSKFCSSCGGEFTEEIKPTFAPVVKEDIPKEKIEDVSGRFVVADGGKRFWAYIIDLLITSAVLSAIIGFAGLAAYGEADIFASTSGFYFETFPFSIGSHGIVLFIYFVITEYFLDATIGKSILGIKVIDEEGRSPALVPVIVNILENHLEYGLMLLPVGYLLNMKKMKLNLNNDCFKNLLKWLSLKCPKNLQEEFDSQISRKIKINQTYP